jgi:predicted nucleic acid-binding protein
MANPPDWPEVHVVSEIERAIENLDLGEREAISLGLRVSADVLLLDERRGRQAARDRGLAVAGTLGVLDLADRRGLARLADAIDRLKATNFRASLRVLKHFGGSSNS